MDAWTSTTSRVWLVGMSIRFLRKGELGGDLGGLQISRWGPQQGGGGHETQHHDGESADDEQGGNGNDQPAACGLSCPKVRLVRYRGSDWGPPFKKRSRRSWSAPNQRWAIFSGAGRVMSPHMRSNIAGSATPIFTTRDEWSDYQEESIFPMVPRARSRGSCNGRGQESDEI